MVKVTEDIYNASIASYAISASFQLGLLESIKNESQEGVNIKDFSKKHGLYLPLVEKIAFVLSHYNLVNYQDLYISKGENFHLLYNDKGYFCWINSGYGDLLQDLASLCNQKIPKSTIESKRKGDAIALAGKDYGFHYVDQYFDELIKKLSIQSLVDFGCGTGNRLIKLAKNNPNFFGVGIEVNAKAVEVARNFVKENHLEDQIQILHEDANHIQYNSLFEKIEALSSFFMGHDLWPKENCIEIFKQYKTLFPHVKYFIFSDTYRSSFSKEDQIPIFTLGFELIHEAMRQYIPSLEEWYEVFDQSGWRCIEEIPLGIPCSSTFVLEPIK